jgi:5-methylcytosine-specific restriction endonuclease McrA
MAQPKLQAQFFIDASGCATPKARSLLRSEKFSFYQRSAKRCAECSRPVRFGGTTASPFEPVSAGHIDHVIPRARGGQNDASNLQLLCISCNTAKGAR